MLRTIFSIVLSGAIIWALSTSPFWGNVSAAFSALRERAEAIGLLPHHACTTPLTYHVGTIDQRFGLTETEVRAALIDAEGIWEQGSGRDLLEYRDDGVITVNLVYDERQQTTVLAEKVRDLLGQKRDALDDAHTLYQKARTEYDAARTAYETERAAYDRTLARYNAEVRDWNEKGGAPQDVYARLEQEAADIAKEGKKLNALGDELNDLAARVNTLATNANESVESYNADVRSYNANFHETEPFTQGLYSSTHIINIYQFGTQRDLRIVLAHELGHALGLGHVASDTQAIMYERTGEQELSLTATDRAALETLCRK